MNWYLNQEWNDTIHSEFYKHYKKADQALQGHALFKQAELLIESENQGDLKAAESLLLLWSARHNNSKQDEKKVEALVERLSSKLHQLESAQIKPRVRRLRPE